MLADHAFASVERVIDRSGDPAFPKHALEQYPIG